jgi:hypothetical protein
MMILYQKLFCFLLYEVSLYIPTYLFQVLDCNAVSFCAENFIPSQFLLVYMPQSPKLFAVFEVLLLYTKQNKY